MLAPEGYGEIIGGGERVADYDLLLKRLRENNLPKRRSAGTWTFAVMAACRTRASGWAWNAQWRGFAELSTSVK